MAAKHPEEEETTTTTTEEPENTSRNLEGGPDAEDALGVKKNVVGPVHDDAPADNSPTTEDVSGDADENIRRARDEGLRNGRREVEDAKEEPKAHPYEKSGAPSRDSILR